MAQYSFGVHNQVGRITRPGRASVRAGGCMRPRWPGNRGGGRHARGARTLAGHTIWVVSAAMVIICGIVVMTPTGGAVQLATRMADAVGTSPRQAPEAPPAPTDGRSFNGTPAVGALFTVSGGQLARHFCTA